MSKSTFTILFYARKNQVNRAGKIGIMIREVEDGGGKISLRTSEHYNASELCKALGGGGHAAAAGATVPGGITGARHAILSLLAQRGIIRER